MQFLGTEAVQVLRQDDVDGEPFGAGQSDGRDVGKFHGGDRPIPGERFDGLRLRGGMEIQGALVLELAAPRRGKQERVLQNEAGQFIRSDGGLLDESRGLFLGEGVERRLEILPPVDGDSLGPVIGRESIQECLLDLVVLHEGHLGRQMHQWRLGRILHVEFLGIRLKAGQRLLPAAQRLGSFVTADTKDLVDGFGGLPRRPLAEHAECQRERGRRNELVAVALLLLQDNPAQRANGIADGRDGRSIRRQLHERRIALQRG